MIVTLPRRDGIDIAVPAPPSKSYTHRAFLAAALAKGKSTIVHPLVSDDTELTKNALSLLGTSVITEEKKVTIEGCNGAFPCPPGAVLDLDNSGTSLRLLASSVLLAGTPVTLTGSARMQERPLGPLADTLASLGAKVTFGKKNGFPPVTIGGSLTGGSVTVDGSVSSQFASSVLMAAPYAKNPVSLAITGTLASGSYLDITTRVMADFGAVVQRKGERRFEISNSERYTGRTYTVEGDYSSASYFFALAAICGGRATVTGLNPESVQGDRMFLMALEKMGCRVTRSPNSVSVEHEGTLSGITIDMSAAPDTVQTLCMVAAMAKTLTRITGIAHLKHKESDRITGTAERLRQLGALVDTEEDQITIRPGHLHGGTIDPENDHRTAMSFAVLGMGIGDVTITNAECVTKSYPGFWDTLAPVME